MYCLCYTLRITRCIIISCYFALAMPLYSKLTVAELRHICEANGIEHEGLTKRRILEILREYNQRLAELGVPCPPVAFLSDSTLKAVVQKEGTQSTIITNNWERNVLLFRGKTATEITSAAKDQLVQLISTGVKKFIVSIGTNDLLQLPLNSIEPKKAASRVVTSIMSYIAFPRVMQIY